MLANNTIRCLNCSIDYYNYTGICNYGCSILCLSCYGPHYGLCYDCQDNSELVNLHCIPRYNTMGGAAYQLYYSAFNHPSFFNGGQLQSEDSCISEVIYASNSTIELYINEIQSYLLIIKWKIYLF